MSVAEKLELYLKKKNYETILRNVEVRAGTSKVTINNIAIHKIRRSLTFVFLHNWKRSIGFNIVIRDIQAIRAFLRNRQEILDKVEEIEIIIVGDSFSTPAENIAEKNRTILGKRCYVRLIMIGELVSFWKIHKDNVTETILQYLS